MGVPATGTPMFLLGRGEQTAPILPSRTTSVTPLTLVDGLLLLDYIAGMRILPLLLLLLSASWLQAQDIRYIRFRDESATQSLQSFHISRVKDDRIDTVSMGTIRTGLLGKKTTEVGIEKGAATALHEWLSANFRQQASTTPVELHIAQLAIRELPGGIRTRIEASFVLAFWVNGERITDYKGTGELQTMGDLFKHLEDMIRQNLRSSLVQFDDWWGKNKLLYEKDAPVALTISLVRTLKDSAQLVYSPKRPLVVNDFLATPDELSRAAAVTASAMTLRYASNIDNGKISVDVQVAAYFDRTRSWFGPAHRYSPKILAHEQRHFDITALKAAELVDTVRQLKLTKENFQEELEKVHAQKQRELDALQRQYDTETKHGTLVAVQERWNRWVAEKLANRVW